MLSSETTLEADSDKAQEKIDMYDIKLLPTLILSSDFEDYGSAIEKQWLQIGSKEDDGSYVLRRINPPYMNTTNGEVEGLVEMIVLTDLSCEGCFDAENFNLPILSRFGMNPVTIKRVDISDAEGVALADSYDITKAPTILLRGDVSLYSLFSAAWKDVGSVEDDGTYVFRNLDAIRQPYKDLDTGELTVAGEAVSGNEA